MFKKFSSEEKGQSMVLFAISLVVLIGFAGLAIDGGRLYLAKSQLQKAVDAGALAGGRELLNAIKNSGSGSVNYSSISTTVNNLTKGNYPAGNYTYDPDKHKTKAVEVHGEESVKLMLMPVLKVIPGVELDNVTQVSAVARVKIGNVGTISKGVIPIGINFDILKDPNDPTGTTLQYNVDLPITQGPGTGTNGYYGFLDFTTIPGMPKPCGGECALEYYIEKGASIPISIDQPISPKEGINAAVEDAINEREGDIVYVPIVRGPETNGKLIVEGFAAFQLINYVTEKEAKEINKEREKKGLPPIESHVITAKFLHIANEGDVKDGLIDYGIYNAKLEL